MVMVRVTVRVMVAKANASRAVLLDGGGQAFAIALENGLGGDG